MVALWSQVLRSILMLGLEERIHYGKAAIGVTGIGDRAILAFADGTTAHADIVIGADGANSALRAHATPGREPVELPVAAIYGRSTIETLSKELSDSGVLALEGAPGRGAFFASMQYREAPKTAFGRLAPGANAPDDHDCVMWALTFPRSDGPAGQEPETLHAFARTLAADLHPVIRRMVEQGDPGSLIQTFMRAAQRPTTWTMPHVALLGDAAHLMPPFGAAGGNTALRDAAVLAEKLRTLPPTQALAAYLKEMGAYAFKEVEASVKQVKQLTQTGQLAQWLMLRAMPRLHKRTV